MRIPDKALVSLALRGAEELVSLLKEVYKSSAFYMGLWASSCKRWKVVLPPLFVGVCNTSCARSQNHTPTPGVHTCWSGSYVCLEKRDSSPHLTMPSLKTLCSATTSEPRGFTEGDPALPTHSNILVIFSSPVWRVLKLIVLRVPSNSHFLIALVRCKQQSWMCDSTTNRDLS